MEIFIRILSYATRPGGNSHPRLVFRLACVLLFGALVATRPLRAESSEPSFFWYSKEQPRSGTVIVQDKTRGLLWLLNLKRQRAIEVLLPFNGGNHESALTTNGRWLATGHYETVPLGGSPLSGLPGEEVSLVDLKTLSTRVYPTVASPRPASKSHGVLWLPDGRLAVTAELGNAVVIYSRPGEYGSPQVFDLGSTGCRTPHMLRQVNSSSILMVACRATNPGDTPATQGYLVGIDLKKGTVRAVPSGRGAEGIVITPHNEIWVGNVREDTVSIFGFANGHVELDALVLRARLPVPKPMRLAYEPTTNSVGIITNGANIGAVNFRRFDSRTHQLKDSVVLASRQRGQIDPQGLAATEGLFITGGVNNQSVLVVDAKDSTVLGEVLMPRCPLALQAHDGSCVPTMRNPSATTPAIVDGFAWSPVIPLSKQQD